MPSLLAFRRPSRRRAAPARPGAGGRRRSSGALPSCNKSRQPRCHRNQQFSVTALTDDNSAVVERFSYTAYGVLGIHAPDGTARSATAHTNRYTYTGREWSPEIGLYYYRARWYDAELGRFSSRDPIGFENAALNLCSGYFAAMAAVDPMGTTTWVMPWNPSAEWWFGMTNPYASPPPVAPAGGGGIAALPRWLLLLTPCLAGALGGAGLDALIDYIKDDTFPAEDLRRRICSAVSGCFIGTCTIVLAVCIAGSAATCGAYLLVGGASLVACTALSDKVCELCDRLVGGASTPFFAIYWTND